jgi:colicin import membrane protein
VSEHNLQSGKDKGLGRMILVSALLHLFAISGIVAGITWQGPRVSAPISYTVKLVDPTAVGGAFSPSSVKTSVAPAKKPEVKPTPPAKREERETKVKPIPQPPKAASPQAVPPQAVPPPKPVKKTPQPAPVPSAKKREAQKEVSKKVELSKAQVKKEPEVKTKPMTQTPKARPPAKPVKKTLQPPSTPSAEELDKQYLAAIDRVRRQAVGPVSPALRPLDSAQDRPFDSAQDRLGSGQGSAGVGGAGLGGGGVVRGFEFLVYYNQLQEWVKESWIVAERKQGLSAIVRFGVQPNGEIFDIELVRSSGDGAFDQSALRAVNKVNPLPPPPPAYQREFVVEKVEVTFGTAERLP